MTPEFIAKLLHNVAQGKLSPEKALTELQHLRFEDLGYAKVDHHRHIRSGFPEVILCQGKSPEQVAGIAERIVKRGSALLATRADSAAYKAVKKRIRSVVYNSQARMITCKPKKAAAPVNLVGSVAVICAGTSDIPVAEEAAITAEMLGNPVERLFDVGVAGIHRLLANVDSIRTASVLIVAAGMEGALPSVVGGLVCRPVIAVPTSVGYGASFGGVAALLGMLNSCASNVTVVNIDNGFGAGYAASLMNRIPERKL